jgi:DNA replication protein DnaC
MINWRCRTCGEEQIAFGSVPPDQCCHPCRERREAVAAAERDAGIPARYRGFNRKSWLHRFPEHSSKRNVQAALAWNGQPHWLAIWGPTGTGKTGLATVLLAEHLRAGRRGRWVSGANLADMIRRDFNGAADTLAPYRATSLLVLDEPLAAVAADWYLERLGLLCRSRDEAGRPTIVTAQELPELLLDRKPPGGPPALLSRWLSGLRLHLKGADVRLEARA